PSFSRDFLIHQTRPRASIVPRSCTRRPSSAEALRLPREDRLTTTLSGGTMRTFSGRGYGGRGGVPGLNRRQFGRAAALLAAGAALPFYNEAALAQDLKEIASVPPDAVRLNTNENPMGPCPAALEAIRRVVPLGGRYLFDQTHAFVEAMAADVGLPATLVLPAARHRR